MVRRKFKIKYQSWTIYFIKSKKTKDKNTFIIFKQ